MGFYGNITNTSKTQFQFDRIYPNRSTMESTINVDGIYAGRYVLIEYDSSLERTLDTFPRVYMQNNIAYFVNQAGQRTLVTRNDIDLNDIVYTAADYIKDEQLVPKDCTFWKCTSSQVSGSSTPATFERVISSESNYVMNFNIDTAKFGEGRGYDSTVWQKAYVNGNERYIQIAELNSVVPTFDISADAPTVHPIQPHFDINSTNVYYKLHWQPQWGMRIKEAGNGNVTTSKDVPPGGALYPSDESAEYSIYTYNSSTGQMEQKNISYDAAIYYNKAGFNKDVRTYYEGFDDEIQMAPTGVSGVAYNTHNLQNPNAMSTNQVDIQEFKVLLPSLGNTISDIWDIIYGHGVKVNADETISGTTTNNIRFRDIAWKDAVTGTENSSIGGMTRDLNTLAGCINKVHDLMGMIITDKSKATLDETWFAKNYIYKDNNKYYRIHKFPTYTTNVIGNLNLPKRVNYTSDQEYNTAYASAIQSFLQDKEYFLIKDATSANYKVETLNEKALSALEDSTVIGYQSGFGYEFVQISDMPGKMATIYGLILQMKNLLEVEDSETRDTATVTGAINALNDIIKVFEDLVPGEFLICDANGHVNSANWTTAQDYSYTNYNSNTPTAVAKTFDTDENRWISLSLDKENCEIELKHIFNPIQDTVTTADKNNATKGNGINKSTDDTLKLYTPIVDSMGHVVGKNIETVTLPYGYKTFTTTGSNTNATTDLDSTQDTVSADGATVTPGTAITNSSTTADNTQDSLALNPHNKWIQVKVTDDNIAVAHEVHGIQTNPLTSDINGNGDTITFQDLEFDAAGHVTKNQKHTYTLPYSFKTIAPATQSTAVTNPKVNTTAIAADNTQDALTIASTNKWIRMSADQTNDILSIGHEVHTFEAGNANTEYGLAADVSVTDLDVDNTFEVPVLKFDEAGHITFAETHTVTVPENFNKVVVTVTGKDSVVINGASAAATIEADSLTDTLTFDVGNRWIQIAGNAGNDKITLYHAAPGDQKNTTIANAETPDYGATFNIPEVKYDEAGHISGVSTHTVQFPTPSLNDLTATTASVITGLSMTDGKLAITQTNANVGTLALTDYTIGTSNADIIATDSINSAFGKLQVQMHDEETNRANAITDLNNNLTETINDLDTKLSEADSNEAQAREYAIEALKEALKNDDKAVSGQYVSKVSQSNGKISVSREALPDYSSYWTKIEALEKLVESQGKLIEGLTTRIEALEAFHPKEEEPTNPENPET